MLGGLSRLVVEKTQSFAALQAKRLGGFFIMNRPKKQLTQQGKCYITNA